MTRPEPQAIEASIRTDDGFAVAARIYEPAGAPRASVVIHGATAVPQRYYRRFAAFLASRGARVSTYDYRGVGESRPMSLVDFPASMRDWAELDARAVIRFADQSSPGLPRLSVGHSFGGQLVGLIDEARAVDSALMVGAQLGYVAHWPVLERARLHAVWNLAIPTLSALYGYVPGRFGLSQDLPSGVAREWSRWCRSPNYLMDHVEGARERFARFDRPVLFYSFTDDSFAPEAAVDALLGALDTARVSHRRYAPSELGRKEVGHFGFFRAQAQSRLWNEAGEWLDAAVERRPVRFASRRPSEIEISASDIHLDLQFGRA